MPYHCVDAEECHRLELGPVHEEVARALLDEKTERQQRLESPAGIAVRKLDGSKSGSLSILTWTQVQHLGILRIRRYLRFPNAGRPPDDIHSLVTDQPGCCLNSSDDGGCSVSLNELDGVDGIAYLEAAGFVDLLDGEQYSVSRRLTEACQWPGLLEHPAPLDLDLLRRRAIFRQHILGREDRAGERRGRGRFAIRGRGCSGRVFAVAIVIAGAGSAHEKRCQEHSNDPPNSQPLDHNTSLLCLGPSRQGLV